MAIGSTCVWEVRASGASDNNGGGYIPGSTGTDFSQQNAAQYALTGVTSSGAGNVFLTASAAADMVGNILQVISGTNFTVGFFQITSVSVGVSVTCATNNAAASISTGVGASGVINIGGALATLGKVLGATAIRPSNIVWCTGTFTLTTVLAISLVAGSTATTFVGYTSARGDGGASTWTSSTNSVNIINPSGSSNVLFQNITVTSTAATRGRGVASVSSDPNWLRFVNCIFDGLLVGIDAMRTGTFFGINGLFLENCEVKNCTNEGVGNTFWTSLFAVNFHNNGSCGFRLDTQQNSWVTIDRCGFYSNGSNGADLSANGGTANQRASVISNSYFSTNTGAGIKFNAQVTAQINNNIFDRNTTFGIDFGTGSGNGQMVGQWNNAFYLNTTAARQANVDIPAAFNDITLSADPYTTVGSDFSLNSTAGGGAAVKGAGFPGVLIGAGTGFASPGALDPSSGGTTTTVIAPTKVNYVFLGEGE